MWHAYRVTTAARRPEDRDEHWGLAQKRRCEVTTAGSAGVDPSGDDGCAAP